MRILPQKLTACCLFSIELIRFLEAREDCQHQVIGESIARAIFQMHALEVIVMIRARGALILVVLCGLLTGPWTRSVAEAQQTSPRVTREGTVVSINREASSFVMSTPNAIPREVTVLAQKFPEITVTRQGAVVPASFASLAVGDRVIVQMLMLANGQAVAVTTHVVSRAPTRAPTGNVPATSSGRPAGTGQTGATSGTGSSSGRTGSSGSGSSPGSGLPVDVAGSGSSMGSGVSVNGTGRSSSAGTGVSVGASGNNSSSGTGVSAGNGASLDASGRGSAAGNGVSAGASGRGSAGGAGVSAGASGGGLSAG